MTIQGSRDSVQATGTKHSVTIARDLANLIFDDALPEGTRLPTEQELHQQYGASRNTVREALRLLELRGVITIRSGRGGGPVVRLPRSADLGEALQLVLQFRDVTLADIIDARALIEPLAASAAAINRSETLVARLQEVNDLVLASANDTPAYIVQNRIFHSIIGDTMHLPVMSVYLDALQAIHDSFTPGARHPPERIRRVARAHQKVIDAIKAGDQQAAEYAMRRHVHESKQYWTTNFPQTSMRTLRWLRV